MSIASVQAEEERRTKSLSAVVTATATTESELYGGGEPTSFELDVDLGFPAPPVVPHHVVFEDAVERAILAHNREVDAATKIQGVWRGAVLRSKLREGTYVAEPIALADVAVALTSGGEAFELEPPVGLGFAPAADAAAGTGHPVVAALERQVNGYVAGRQFHLAAELQDELARVRTLAGQITDIECVVRSAAHCLVRSAARLC
jgi:hypothetical protein